MRKDIKVDVLKGDAFRVAYIGDNPITAMKVTDRLASTFIDENSKDREVMAESTNQFLTVQVEDARRSLAEQEKKLELYRERHAGELPSQADSNLQVVQNTQMQLQALLESVNRDQDRRLLVERSLADLSAEESQPPIADNSPDQPAALQLARNAQLLHDMELRLKPEHPDIIRQKKIVAGLQQRAEAEALAAPVSPEGDGGGSPAQQARRNRVKELQQDLENLDRQIAAKRAEEGRLRTITQAYQARLEAVPSRETELSELTRDYATMQRIYSDLLAKTQESKVSANLERRQIGEQFKLLDPARPAEKPFSPNRPRINILGSLLGLGFGLGLVAFLEFRDSSFRNQDDVTSVLALPVLAQIPMIVTAAERRKLGRRRLMVSTAAAAIFVAAGAVVWKLGILNGLLK
jgi:polysaccharide chain length determinant protein (PEP-CTERM system associated)